MAIAPNLIRTPPPVASIRAAVLAPLVQELDRHHGKTDLLLAGHGILRTQLDDPYALVPLARYIEIFEEAATILKEPALGARIGAGILPADIGPLGILFSISSTLRIAFSRLSKYMTALQEATHVGLLDEEEGVSWSYRIEDDRMWPRGQDAEFTLVTTMRLARSCFQPSLKPIEVHFEHVAPRHAAALARIFQVPIRFDQASNRLLFDRAEIDRVYRAEDRGLRAVLERHIRDLVSDSPERRTLVDHVLSIIDIYLGHKPITLAGIARELSMSPRTLQRHLADEGTSLRLLMQRHRQAVAKRHLVTGTGGHARIAQALGYADSTVFGRAFKSWTGDPPSRRRL